MKRTYLCNSNDCNWIGDWSDTVHPKHDPNNILCPECHETTCTFEFCLDVDANNGKTGLPTGYVSHIHIREFGEFGDILDLYGPPTASLTDHKTKVRIGGDDFEVVRYRTHFIAVVVDSILMDAQEVVRLLAHLRNLDWWSEGGVITIGEKWDSGSVTLEDLFSASTMIDKVKEQSLVHPITDYWLQYYANGVCTICGNSGLIDSRGIATPAGIEVGRLNFCICPNGQRRRELETKTLSMGTVVSIERGQCEYDED